MTFPSDRSERPHNLINRATGHILGQFPNLEAGLKGGLQSGFCISAFRTFRGYHQIHPDYKLVEATP